MNLLQRAVSVMAGAAGLDAKPRDMNDPRWWGGGGMISTSGQSVTSETGLQLDIVQSVLGRLGGTVSTLPLMVFERTGDGSERRVARDHSLFNVLHRQPNRRQTAQEYRDEQQQHLAWYRNAYARILPGDTAIAELEIIHPTRVTDVARSTDGWVYYTVRRLAPAIGYDVLREDEVFHIRKAPLTADGLRGKPVFQTGRDALGRAMAVEEFGALYFRNGSSGGTINHPGTFKDREQEQDFLASWREGGSGPNRHRDRLLKYGVTYTPSVVRNDEAQFLDTLKECNAKVCRLWNMPPHLVGMLDKATFSNIEQQSIEYVMHTLAPWISAWEQAAGRDLLIGEDRDRYFVEFNVAGLLRGDLRTRWASYAQGRQWGWLSINDVRRLENMDPIGAAGDEYLQPLNMVPAGTDTSDDPADDPNADPVKDPANAA